jgi:putative membrane protein
VLLPRKLFPDDRWNRTILAAFLMLWAISCIRVPYPEFIVLQHVPTVLAVVGLVVADRRLQIGRVSFTLVVLFLLLHVLGARYIYSYVPYDDWSQRLLGFRLNERFGLVRNHYDRLVHFCFGLLLVWPAWRLFERYARLSALTSAVMGLTCILAMSAVYEIIEWALAMALAPDWAEAYNGQQGDIWDAQWDMALAALGGLVGITLAIVIRAIRPRN